jgi:hypothetical protein
MDEEPYKEIITWSQEGVRITVEVDYPGLPAMTPVEVKEECERRAKAIVNHFKLIIGSA